MSRPEEPSGRGQRPRLNREMIELRLLMEIPAVRKVTEQGVSDSELDALERLAAATMAPARDGDIPGYINADLDSAPGAAKPAHVHGRPAHGEPVASQAPRTANS